MSPNDKNKIFKFLSGKKAGVFVDDSNLYHAAEKNGWRIDLLKFKKLLSQQCDLELFNYYIAIPDKSDAVYAGTEKFLNKIKDGIVIKTKPLKYTPIGGQVVKKADFDVDISLDVVRTVGNLDVVIVVSGDSDFLALKNYVLKDCKKNILFISYESNMAWELKYSWHLFLDDYRKELEYKNK